jgi:hypothetical protein
MTVRDLLTELQRLPRDLEFLALEAGCKELLPVQGCHARSSATAMTRSKSRMNHSGLCV